MVKVWGSTELPRFTLKDFDTKNYRCIAHCVNENGCIVAAFMSKSAMPPHYRVMDGTKEMFYLHRKDAIAYVETVRAAHI